MKNEYESYEQRREKTRNRSDSYYYVLDPESKTVQRAFGKPKLKPRAVIYLPHYEDSLRIEVDLPDGKPEDVQKSLDTYKEKFVEWFGGSKELGHFNWGNKTRRWVYGKVAVKIQGIKMPREDNRALRTLFMYKGILNEFKAGKKRKVIVEQIAKQKEFQFEQVRKYNNRSRTTGVIMETHRKPSTINRDITSLVKMGLIRKTGKGIYEVDEELVLKKREENGITLSKEKTKRK
jgi:hypothetical protein